MKDRTTPGIVISSDAAVVVYVGHLDLILRISDTWEKEEEE